MESNQVEATSCGVIKFRDGNGFTRRIAIPRTSSGLLHTSFSEFADSVRNTFNLSGYVRIRLVARRDDEVVVADDDLTLQGACSGLTTDEPLISVVEKYDRFNADEWVQISRSSNANFIRSPSICTDVLHPAGIWD
eukprot:Gb_04810 [translate_table: standard]